ncbi:MULTISPECIES: MSMEG_1061 family FMN-dependent PPOX-type flavoprotein [unclassified Roseovarius]|uniref:MSMEG_1061 family FMN-dependent PPOX-type flavoprotein n=1 Tax=unclassified Roseovarius TaxID=2614913 RepID=UPI00273F7E9F|nr:MULTISPECIES: MSMEG_1061 family FMN-dependent PPOX-type flavoprotein [unclassified Roseovarius]
MYEPKDVLTSIEQVYANQRQPYESQTQKFIDHIDDLCRIWIEHSTFLTMATVDRAGNMDISPKGDPAGFVKVLDPKTLAIPDRPGNHRYDGFRNIMETGRVGLVFLVPNRNEVVRVNGSAVVVEDMAVREQCAIKGRVPDFAVIVRVEEAFYHCGKSIIRSRLWHPDAQLPVDALPTYAEALMAHGELTEDIADLAARLRHNDEKRLYDE